MDGWSDERTAAGFSRVGEGGMASEFPEVGNLESAVREGGYDMVSISYFEGRDTRLKCLPSPMLDAMKFSSGDFTRNM